MQSYLDLKPNRHCSLRINSIGDHLWRNPEGQYHRVDESGVQDGPALIWADEVQFWFLNGKMHRLDGPAWIHPDGSQRWYLDGVQMTQEKWAQDPRVIEFHSKTSEEAEEWLKSL